MTILLKLLEIFLKNIFEKYVERMTSFNGYIYASTIIKQPTYIKTDTIESITLIEERGK